MKIPANRPYRTVVTQVTRLSPHLIRITVGDESLRHFTTAGPDQLIKLLLPRPDGSLPEIGLFDDPPPPIKEWYGKWRELPNEERNPIRSYTVRAARPTAREIDIDFVIHGDGDEGPASAWAASAQPGDELVLLGPDNRSDEPILGVGWHPGLATRVLLAGDETALPAITAILESLPNQISGHAYIEVPTAADVLSIESSSSIHQLWLPREGAAHGQLLTAAVMQWGDSQPGTPQRDQLDDASLSHDGPSAAHLADYAWLAGERSAVTRLRRYLVFTLGFDRRDVVFTGYWREGHSEN